MNALEGRAALVTGGAVRIGRSIVLALAAAGADVAVHYRRSEAEAEATVAAVREYGRRGVAVRAELADADACAQLVDDAVAALGRSPDILVNNASVFELAPPESADLDAWARQMRVNLRAPLLLSQAFAARLLAGAAGDIVNLNDIHALGAWGRDLPYILSKQGLHALTRDLALALAPRVKVNEVALGAVLAPASPPPGYRPTPRSRLPLDRFPTPDDVAAAVLFLVTCPAVTGQTVTVDGGEHLLGAGDQG